jgi:hypothetical protein
MHSAFLETYRAVGWEKPYRSLFCQTFAIAARDVPEFYLRVAGDNSVRALIEYPMPIEDHHNIHYYYQHFHKKRVYVGYMPGERQARFNDGQVFPPIGVYLHNADAHQAGVRFTNLIDIGRPEEVRKTGASCFVVHKDYFAEIRGAQSDGIEPQVETLTASLRREFGELEYEDARLWVFAIGEAQRGACAVRR